MPKTLAAEPSLNPALLAFKPRQLLIHRPVMGKESKTSTTLESEQKGLLLRSIAQYLDRCGFSKCYKKLLSEAEIEKKELNTTLPDLVEIYSEFLKKRDHEAAVNVITEANATEGVDNVKKEKKKKKETKPEVTEEEKEKVKETDAEIKDGLKEKKKKKKNKSKSIEAEVLGDDGEEKASKKRKRVEPEETKEETKDDFEESKRRKKEEENVVEDEEDVQETPVKQTDIQANGNVEKSETKSTGKGLSNSKEPKKPFQRVNVEDVVFTDDRLKDNSYWAKDGADIGYGAKAQEVLGQVRGRGFRHEKTKKKRGSYRGGEIDLQSHSVKFDYSEEE